MEDKIYLCLFTRKKDEKIEENYFVLPSEKDARETVLFKMLHDPDVFSVYTATLDPAEINWFQIAFKLIEK